MAIKVDEIINAHDINNGIIRYVIDQGSANNYILNIDGINTYYEGLRICMKCNHSNTGSSVININNLGNKKILDEFNKELNSGLLLNGHYYNLICDGNNFVITNMIYVGNSAFKTNNNKILPAINEVYDVWK